MKKIYLRNEFPNLHDHCEVIEHIAKWLKPERYLEIGVQGGKCLTRVQQHAKECYAVDVHFPHRNYMPHVYCFEMTSNKFFNIINTDMMFDMAFIDGEHNKRQVYRDFLNIKDRIIEDGFVLLHDSYPINEDMLHPSVCEDSWEAVKKIKEKFHTDWEIITFPFNPGLTIMKKMKLEKQILWR